ncbi:MAG: glycosyltransferase family 2 protein [Bacillota bacterium]
MSNDNFFQNSRHDLSLIKRKSEIIKKHDSQINKVLPSDCPLVSILIINRNGANHLTRLFRNFKKNTFYPNYEIVVVDNNSTDNSIGLLQELSKDLPIQIIRNKKNTTFSAANNQAAQLAKGQYLVLLNNDVEPLKGWLNEMIHCWENTPNIGAVGSKLIYPILNKQSIRKNKSLKVQHSIRKNKSLKVQHSGIAFTVQKGSIIAFNMGNGLDPFDASVNIVAERAAVTGASILTKRDLYFKVGGLDEQYNYGYEDVDYCLKLFSRGFKNIYCPTSVLFHYEFGTQESDNRNKVRARRLKNKKLLQKKWGAWIERNILKHS